jgi:hypothetical protein
MEWGRTSIRSEDTIAGGGSLKSGAASGGEDWEKKIESVVTILLVTVPFERVFAVSWPKRPERRERTWGAAKVRELKPNGD